MSAGELPQGWVDTKLGEVVDYGKTTKAEPQDIQSDTWVLELEDVERDSSKILQKLYFSERQSKSTKNRFNKGDVLYGKLRPYLSKIVMASDDGVCTTEIVPLSGGKFVDNKYLFYWLKGSVFKDYVDAVSYGVNMPRLGTKDGLDAPFIFVPPAEQQQIAAKLDELLAQVDSLKTRLDAIPKILKRFRQSVLAAAVSGKLTEEWRGKSGLSEWEMGTWGSILNPAKDSFKRGPFGSSLTKSMFVSSGYKIYEQYCPINDDCSYERYYIDEKKFEEMKTFEVLDNDFLISCSGVSLGRITQVPKGSKKGIINQAILRVRLDHSKYNSDFFKILFRSPPFQKMLLENSTGSAIPNLKGVKELKSIIVPLIPLTEQTEITHRVEQLFAYADQIEQRVQDAQSRVNHLTQSILAKAFRGELTAEWREQNPDLISGENSAEALLARIQAEREKGGKVVKTRSKKVST